MKVFSKVTSQGQISVPAEVRRKLGLGAGSSLEWVESENGYQVKRATKYTFDDIRAVLRAEKEPGAKTDEELDEAAALYVQEQHARGRY